MMMSLTVGHKINIYDFISTSISFLSTKLNNSRSVCIVLALQRGHIKNINGFIFLSINLITIKLGMMTDQLALVLAKR